MDEMEMPNIGAKCDKDLWLDDLLDYLFDKEIVNVQVSLVTASYRNRRMAAYQPDSKSKRVAKYIVGGCLFMTSD